MPVIIGVPRTFESSTTYIKHLESPTHKTMSIHIDNFSEKKYNVNGGKDHMYSQIKISRSEANIY